ncbi:conserved hypothetical protein [Luteimonas sp. 9C]|uniref:hypothetical protein n=1 Tax=Luteimonas sp. 9C TaxID=2653148 RepID=UPI0012EF5CC8|nr:hypothetical protein [Luteimonas sp. 9C]VXB34892.1 conserved hypothetical protein [Luteimonas sp. 9C]
MSRDDAYWFPAKTRGYGWGLPRRWPGWVVLAVYLAAIALSAWRCPPSVQPVAFGVCLLVATVLLVAVCALKGEPPRWRWTR